MQIPDKLEEPFTYSWKLVIIMLIIIFVVVIIVLFRKYVLDKFLKVFKKVYDDKKVPSLKTKYLRKLEKLLIDVKNGRIEIRDGYLKLSNIIRDFIEKVTGINVSTMSKIEVEKIELKPLNMLMDEYYPPEFAKYSKGDIVNSINRTMEVIRKWN